MNVELRANGEVSISGYVNVCERESRPVMTEHGRVNELIECRAFQNALEDADKVNLMVDHARVIGDTTKNLSLHEDNIGLRAELTTDDAEVVESAKSGKIKGWSFGMRNVKEKMVQRAEPQLPLRKVTGLELDEVSLIINMNPCYSATSVEMRADGEDMIETRATTDDVKLTIEKTPVDYSEYEKTIKSIKEKEIQ